MNRSEAEIASDDATLKLGGNDPTRWRNCSVVEAAVVATFARTSWVVGAKGRSRNHVRKNVSEGAGNGDVSSP
jgi:hypothetical protein